MLKFGGSNEGLEFESDLSDLAIGKTKKRKKYNKVTCSFSDAAFKALSNAAIENDVTKSQLMKAMTITSLKNGMK